MEYFESSRQHLFAELERIDLLIAAQVTSFRQNCIQDEQFRGLYISEEEVDVLLAQPVGLPLWAKTTPSLQLKVEQLETIKQENHSRAQKSLNKGIELRLVQMQRIFDLDQFDIDTLLVCLAVEVDLRYERLYAYLQDDVTKKHPSVDLILNLLSSTPEIKFSQHCRFHPEAPLVRFSLLDFIDDSSQQHPPLLTRYLKVDSRIVRFLFGSDQVDERLSQFSMMSKSQRPSPTPLANESVVKLTDRFLKNNKNQKKTVFYLRGPYGIGKLHTAQAVCHKQSVGLLVGDLQKIALKTNPSPHKIVNLFHREAMLQNSALLWKNFDSLLDEKNSLLLDQFLNCLRHGPTMTFFAGEKSWEPSGALRNILFASFEIPNPSFAERVKIWSAALDKYGLDKIGLDIASVAGKFKFTGGQILDAVATTGNLMEQCQLKTDQIATEKLHQACRLHSNQKLTSLARKITPHFNWNDIILPSDRQEQMRDICNFVKYRNRVHSDWGFSGKLSLGKGINVLFAGPSGTGKTMAAEIIGGELDLDIFKIDISTVVSKYVGETEKNLAHIFREAETSNAILFFDEADALFGKRSEIKDSHDRYANIETAYLLQRMEEYEGVVILATNLRKNMDEAFVRRLNFAIDFPFPGEQDRLRIWEKIWPSETPVDPKLDLHHLARQFEINGGNIRNIALAAAFYAADDSCIIDMDQLLRATKREYQKMGKVVGQSEFIVAPN